MKDTHSDSKWQFCIDVGGTFTDCVATGPDGKTHVAKVLSSGATKGHLYSAEGNEIADPNRTEPDGFWRDFEFVQLDAKGNTVFRTRVVSSDSDGRLVLADTIANLENPSYELICPDPSPILAIRKVLGLPWNEALPSIALDLGTTKGTNALLTRSGSRVAYLTTQGFKDALLIGDQSRPNLFARDIVKPQPLFENVYELNERVSSDGETLVPLDESRLSDILKRIRNDGCDSLAICLLHSYKYPRHEQIAAKIAKEAGFQEVSCSHQVTPTIRLVPRGQTTVLDAYLNPLLRFYFTEIKDCLGVNGRLRLMTSMGTIVDSTDFTGKDSILSGPAGGVVGFSRVAERMGFSHAIGLDMGGTSTDVARYDGQFEEQFETTKAGIRIVHPVLAIETVAAGGGSICSIVDGRIQVGPESAGAEPGPACYGKGGPLTVTDVNLFLGRIDEASFPFRLDRSIVESRLDEACVELNRAQSTHYDRTQLAEGFFRIAVERMAKAIHSISIARGYDPREYALVAFGGASPQVACAVASELEIGKIIVHPLGSVLSAHGIGLALPSEHRLVPVGKILNDDTLRDLEAAFENSRAVCSDSLLQQGYAANQIVTQLSLDLRYVGTDAFLAIPEPGDGDFRTAFEEIHAKQFGYTKSQELEVVSMRCVCKVDPGEQRVLDRPPPQQSSNSDKASDFIHAGDRQKIAKFNWPDIAPGQRIAGPAMIAAEKGATIVEPGWDATCWDDGQLLLEKQRQEPTSTVEDQSKELDPVLLEVFESNFGVIAEQMGLTLQRTANSVNVKERLDFSCALFNSSGELIVNAPHIPVHLGAMSQTVKSVLGHFGEFKEGDVIVTNDPYQGGSHLPDVTVITPVFLPSRERHDFFVASRCHHAEIGGISPGSMPPNASCLGEEGVLISNLKLIDQGKERFNLLDSLLRESRYPSRMPQDNISDVIAQVAANRRGAEQLISLANRYGRQQVIRYMGHCLDAAERKMKLAIRSVPNGKYDFTDQLDTGARIAVQIEVADESMSIDFGGTSPVQANNLNANRGIVTAAVIYFLRLLINRPLSLNDGILRPVEIELPECFLNPASNAKPFDRPPVVGGNVETSQRIVDVLLGALKIAAASQGTMNNLLLGDETFGYYETICGGSGATENADGADAVHTHMTNTRITDPEVFETRFPFRLHRFEIRRESGGAGIRSGGDGVIREIECLNDLEISIISNRRNGFQPFGIEGGEPGAAGRNLLIDTAGETTELTSQAQAKASAGTRIRIETPGGGGFGKPN